MGWEGWKGVLSQPGVGGVESFSPQALSQEQQSPLESSDDSEHNTLEAKSQRGGRKYTQENKMRVVDRNPDCADLARLPHFQMGKNQERSDDNEAHQCALWRRHVTLFPSLCQ